MSVTYEQLKELIKSRNNPKLVDTELSPLENTIYHVYSDGEITEQKGSWGYGQRSERTIIEPKFNNIYQKGLFPYERQTNFGTFGYAVVTRDDAVAIVDMISKYFASKK